jgi:hypothetical protein
MANVNWCYVAYHDGVERVQIVKKRVSSRGLPRDIKNPVLVRDEDGDEFVVGDGELFNNPMQASKAMAKMQAELGMAANPVRGPEDEEEEDEEEDEDDEEVDDEDSDEEDEEDLDEDDADEDDEEDEEADED